MKWFGVIADFPPLILRIILKLKGSAKFFYLFIGIFFSMVFSEKAIAQHPDVPYVPTPESVVEMMLDLADVKQGDYLIDLGSGDGRIVIAAAKRGAFGHGIEIDGELVENAKENAIKEGVENNVLFVEGNIFDVDFSRADVVTMYLFNSINMILRPTLLNKLRPGSHVVSHRFDMNAWKPDKQLNAGTYDIYLWIIPAKADGIWSWKLNQKEFTMNVNQQFQKISVDVDMDNASLKTENCNLMGKKIWFNAVDTVKEIKYIYNGIIEGDSISGIVQIHSRNTGEVFNWVATNNKYNDVEDNEQLLGK